MIEHWQNSILYLVIGRYSLHAPFKLFLFGIIVIFGQIHYNSKNWTLQASFSYYQLIRLVCHLPYVIKKVELISYFILI